LVEIYEALRESEIPMDEREMQASGSPDTPSVDDHGQLGML
jgi:hypothetical protein